MAPISDPVLVDHIAAAVRDHVDGTTPPTVAIEALTAVDARVAHEITALGGTVTGSVPGAVVQARVPVDRAAAVAAAPGVSFVQAPRAVNQRPRRVEAGFGELVNNGVGAMNATAWHDAGLRGAGVRVGIVDFLATAQWNSAEQGPLPTVANGHMFCLDSIGEGLCNPDGSVNSAAGDPHGLAVTEIVKDAAPDADVYVATVATVSDLPRRDRLVRRPWRLDHLPLARLRLRRAGRRHRPARQRRRLRRLARPGVVQLGRQRRRARLPAASPCRPRSRTAPSTSLPATTCSACSATGPGASSSTASAGRTTGTCPPGGAPTIASRSTSR